MEQLNSIGPLNELFLKLRKEITGEFESVNVCHRRNDSIELRNESSLENYGRSPVDSRKAGLMKHPFNEFTCNLRTRSPVELTNIPAGIEP